ncbi:hypothetical protein Scep_007582 [Stephania cephalantha]|uniref:Uncharacterized protein n=1 Tax=Stephania cephalantha TaxID=152367 RepID=A0AAP0PNZ2_9MAGN
MMHIMQCDFICIIADHIRPLKKFMLNLSLGKKSLCFMEKQMLEHSQFLESIKM